MTERQIKNQAGYVQIEGFADAGAGYCCGTCKNLMYEGDRSGYCTTLEVPVVTYGCCNYWVLAPDDQVRGYNGRRLRVLP